VVNELQIAPARLPAMLHYDGTPITARFITQPATKAVHAMTTQPLAAK